MLDSKMLVWYNGKIQKAEEINVGIFTHALHYGTGIFEGMRSYSGKIFKEKEHYERLFKSGELVDIPVGYSIEELIVATKKVLKENNLTDAYIRPIAWRGGDTLGIKSYQNPVNVAIIAWQWGNYHGEDKVTKGINLCQSKFVRPDPRSTETQAKASGLYFVGSSIQNKAYKDGYDDVLMLDWRGYVSECTSCNIFFIKDKTIHTPIPDCFLNGITRQTIIDLTKKMGYKIEERYITSQELLTFDEAFVTGTAVEVMPVAKIFDHIIMKSTAKSLEIRQEYIKLVNY